VKCFSQLRKREDRASHMQSVGITKEKAVATSFKNPGGVRIEEKQRLKKKKTRSLKDRDGKNRKAKRGGRFQKREKKGRKEKELRLH